MLKIGGGLHQKKFHCKLSSSELCIFTFHGDCKNTYLLPDNFFFKCITLKNIFSYFFVFFAVWPFHELKGHFSPEPEEIISFAQRDCLMLLLL